MATELRPRRQNSNKLLFEFDSLVDIDLGIVLALQEDYPPGELSTINYSFLHQSLPELKQARVFLYGRDVVQECFLTDNTRKSYQAMKDYYKTQKKVYEKAPITSLVRLIKVYGQTNFIQSLVLCHSQFELETANKLLGNTPGCTIKIGKESEIDVNTYARIHLGDIHQLDKFNEFDCTHIAILNYGSNLQLIDHDVILLRDYVIRFGDTNIFEIIDSYTDVECPDYGKID